MDLQFEFPEKIPEFELLDLDHYWAMGPNKHFRVKGVFQVMTPAKDETPAIPLANCTTDELDKVIVQPNWFESLFRIEIFYGQNHISSSEEPPEIIPYLNIGNTITWTKVKSKSFFLKIAIQLMVFLVRLENGTWTMLTANGENIMDPRFLREN